MMQKPTNASTARTTFFQKGTTAMAAIMITMNADNVTSVK